MPNTTYGSPYAQSSDLVSNWPGVSLNVADRLDDVSFKGNGLNDQTGTTYTLVLTDAGKTVTLNNASAVTVTVPTNASVAYETGTCIYFTNKGAGVVTISAAGGVTLNNSSTIAQYASCYIQKLDTNTWVMVSAPAAGLTLITSSTFSAVSSVSVNSCFTSAYTNYQLLINIDSVSVANSLDLRLRVSGSDNSSSNYYYNGAKLDDATTTSVTAFRSTGLVTFFRLLIANSGTAAVRVDMYNPQASVRTAITHQSIGQNATDMASAAVSGIMSVTTSYDGFTLIASTGNITGTLRVYGYRNS